MRSIKNEYKPVFEPIAGLDTYRVMPTAQIDQIDPFLFLNHHGPQIYPPNNSGLPFGPHPHRGFETLTYIFSGDIVHEDTGGFKSKIDAGGIQWMTAGSGLLHSERSSEEFLKNGGEVEVLQLWMNLPAKYKMVKPHYHGLQKPDIPSIKLDNGKVRVNLISGEFNGQKGPVDSITGLTMTSIEFDSGGNFKTDVFKDQNILFYVVKGKLEVNGRAVTKHSLIEFGKDDTRIEINAVEDGIILFGYGKPLNEPIVAQGPFVMNTREEITQAIRDYQSGKMGIWKEEEH
jgi:quercetin 2,3-dioxygenase